MGEQEPCLDLAWGAKNIAKEIGLSERQAFHLLASGAFSFARKVRGRWCADRATLRLFFRSSEPAASDVAPL